MNPALLFRPMFVCILLVSTPLLLQAAAPVSVPGLTEPVFDANLSTPVAGLIQKLNFKEGDFVRKGEVILELDKGLEQVEVARRHVVLGPLKTDLDAIRFLYEKPNTSVSKETLEEKELAYNVAVKEHELAEEKLRQRFLLAPFDGIISELFFEVGEACQLQQPVLRLVDTRRCYFVGNVEAKAGYALKLGQEVQLEVEAGKTPVVVTGKISFISPVVDPASGLLKIKAIFENPDGRVRPGVAGKMILPEAVYAHLTQ